MHIEYLSNGMGSQSMLLLHLAAQKIIPATLSITADTGDEDDCLLSTGQRCTARDFFDNYIQPYAEQHRINAYFVRVRRKNGEERPPISEYTRQVVEAGLTGSIKIPVFGSHGGRFKQSCTSIWKVMAINQQLRRLGAVTARGAIGIHAGEVQRRAKGTPLGKINGFRTMQNDDAKWLTHYYPLADLQLDRPAIAGILEREGIVYVQHSQCSICPHQDWLRWSERSPESIRKAADFEAALGGDFFLTNRRKPLVIALEEMRCETEVKARQAEIRGQQTNLFTETDFGCENDVCGI